MKSIREADLKGKKVLIRVDFNVEIDENGKVVDDFRLKATLPTLNWVLDQGAAVIVMAHLGRPFEEKEKHPEINIKERFTLKPVALRLSELIAKDVVFVDDCAGPEAREKAGELAAGEILMLENLRFYKEEEENDREFAEKLASLGDIYVNDAFANCHRAHASVEAITKFLPGYAGLLLAKEVENLSRAKNNPDHPLVILIGGAKISTKIKLIQNFLGKAEHILLGGALANTVLQSQGVAIGRSLTEEKMLVEVKNLNITETKIHLPVDVILAKDKKGEGECYSGPVGKVGEDEFILDIGPDTEALFAKIIQSAKMVVWNGPVGLFETAKTSHGTQAMAKAIAESSAYSIVGGGETVTYLEKNNLVDKFSFVSTGGGAMMEFLSGEPMPGLKALEEN